MKAKFFKTAIGTATIFMSVLLMTADRAAAAYNWTGVAPTLIDGDDPGIEARDIINAWHASDGTNHYFRIELEAAPSNTDNAGLYGIYISTDSTTGNLSDHNYVPSGIMGIDLILDSHFDLNQDWHDGVYDGWYQHDLHTYNASLGVYQPQGLTTHSESGTFMEWWIPVATLGNSFEWLAASHEASGPGYDTYDTTSFLTVNQVPLPGSVFLLLPGLSLIAGIRRKQA